MNLFERTVEHGMVRVMTNGQLQKELEYFKVNQKELVEQYAGKFLVIKDQKIHGVYETAIEAYTEAKKRFELGTFFYPTMLAW